MPITVQIPAALRRFAGNQDILEFNGRRVAEVIDQLTAAHPDIRRHLCNEDGTLRNFVNVYVNDEDVRYLHQQETPLRDGDVITIVPAVAGG